MSKKTKVPKTAIDNAQTLVYCTLSKTMLYDNCAKEEYGDWNSAYELDDVSVYLDPTNICYDYLFKIDAVVSGGDKLFIIIEKYSDGDSFGSCDQDFSIRNIFTTKAEAVSWCNEHNIIDGYFEHHLEWIIAKRTVTVANEITDCFDNTSKIRFI